MKKSITALLAGLMLSQTAMAAEKSVLLYIGYSDSNGQKVDQVTSQHLSSLSGATEFVVSPTYSVQNMQYASYNSYDSYINDTISLIRTIRSTRPDAKVAISTPPLIQRLTSTTFTYVYPAQPQDIQTFLTTLRQRIVNEFGSQYWDYSISGIYLYDEELNGAWLQTQKNEYVHELDQYMNSVYSPDKKLLWYPYYALENESIISSWVETGIFDTVNIQPNVFFKSRGGTPDQSILGTIKTWMKFQNVNGKSNPNTEIGAVLEIENSFERPEIYGELTVERAKRYHANYAATFQWMAQDYSLAYYAGAPNWYNQTPAMLECMNNVLAPNIELLQVTWTDGSPFTVPKCMR